MPLVGRDRELAEITALLRREDVRCVTLTGPGGTGKTRLALEVAGANAGDYRDGVFLVPLSAIRDPSLVMGQVATVLGVNESAGQNLHAYLANKTLLLLIDNVEQVVGAAADLARMLAEAPRVRLLVTGREALHVTAERVYPVPPLGLLSAAPEVAGSGRRPLLRGRLPRRSCTRRRPVVRDHGRKRRDARGDLSPARRPAAGARAGRGPPRVAVAGGDPGW